MEDNIKKTLQKRLDEDEHGWKPITDLLTWKKSTILEDGVHF